MKNINRQPGAQGKDEEAKGGASLSNRGLKVPASGKSTFAKHRNTNSISGAAGLSGVNKSMDGKPGIPKTNSTREPGSALSKKSSISG